MGIDVMRQIISLHCRINPLLNSYFKAINHNNYLAHQFKPCFYCAKCCCMAFMSELRIPLDSNCHVIQKPPVNPAIDMAIPLGFLCADCAEIMREGGIFNESRRKNPI